MASPEGELKNIYVKNTFEGSKFVEGVPPVLSSRGGAVHSMKCSPNDTISIISYTKNKMIKNKIELNVEEFYNFRLMKINVTVVNGLSHKEPSSVNKTPYPVTLLIDL